MEQDESLATELVGLSFSVQDGYREAARRHGLTPQQARLICVVGDEPVGMAELAVRLHCEKSTLTGLVDRAQQRGLLHRTPDPHDGRAFAVTLTGTGRRLADDVHREATQVVLARLDHLPPGMTEQVQPGPPADATPPATHPVAATKAERAVWEAFSYAAEQVRDALERRVQGRADMPPSYFELMVKLKHAPGQRLRMNELAAATRTRPSRITHAVTRLARAGWVTRDNDPDDRRSFIVTLTDQGHAAMATARPEYHAIIRDHVLAPLSPAERGQLQSLCEKILATFETTS